MSDFDEAFKVPGMVEEGTREYAQLMGEPLPLRKARPDELVDPVREVPPDVRVVAEARPTHTQVDVSEDTHATDRPQSSPLEKASADVMRAEVEVMAMRALAQATPRLGGPISDEISRTRAWLDVLEHLEALQKSLARVSTLSPSSERAVPTRVTRFSL